MGKILFAGKEPQEGAAVERDMVANRATEHRKAGLECIENRPHGDRAFHFKLDFALDASQCAEVEGYNDSDHGEFNYRLP